MSVSSAADDATPLISASAADDKDERDPDAYDCPFGFLWVIYEEEIIVIIKNNYPMPVFQWVLNFG